MKLPVAVRPGYHVNSNAPEEDYLIPLRVTWTGAAAKPEQTVYPHAKHERFAFSMKPLATFSGTFDVITKFKADPNAHPGPATITGKVRYQACNDRECLPPRTIEVPLPLDIR